MKFSIVLIGRNEEKTLPRLFKSLEEFKKRGGEIVLVDTGSKDKTAQIARDFGCIVEEVGERFITVITKNIAYIINKKFVVKGEKDIVKEGDKLFDFASARNYADSLASNDMICTLDCDETYSVCDYDKINKLIDEGWEQFEYLFCYAHDPWGKPAIEFVQSKFFNRTKDKWVGIVHEVLQGNAKRMFLPKDVIYLEHWQQPGGEHRGNYLVGLALDCYQHPDKDRQSHYLAREMLWNGRPKSAIKEFERHIKMMGWPIERAQSMIFIGDGFGMLNEPEKQAEWYSRAFYHDSGRREALIKLAQFYKHNNNFQATICFAKAALEIPWTGFYANNKQHYEAEPHALLYWAYGWMGNIEQAQVHIKKALEYQPQHPEYLRDLKYYFTEEEIKKL